jgi:hypothetical protein
MASIDPCFNCKMEITQRNPPIVACCVCSEIIHRCLLAGNVIQHKVRTDEKVQ